MTEDGHFFSQEEMTDWPIYPTSPDVWQCMSISNHPGYSLLAPIPSAGTSTVTRGGVRLSVQDDYANRVEDLAIEAKVQGQIGGFHLWLENQLAVLQAALTPVPATWADVAAAIRGIPTSEVNRATDAHRANAALQQQMDQISRSMQTMCIAPVAPRTQMTFPVAPRPVANPSPLIAPNVQAQRGAPSTATQNPRPDLPQFGRDYVPTQDELTHIRATRELVVSIAQPDMEQGRATYAQQKARWLHDTQNERATGDPSSMGKRPPTLPWDADTRKPRVLAMWDGTP
ncbi:unnamed protein product [Mycena citricolor]|uniref:Uncharacterized protein n=1 Tax=Mycena citricolor TaxID=2018698 RepID=A0AAD2I1V4_9AGAR|nr:unnamed protein product [Mycena citricolor]